MNKKLSLLILPMAFAGIMSASAYNTNTITEDEDVLDENTVSGIKSIEYKLEGATKQGWTEYTQPFQITNKGITFITSRVEDMAGNIVQNTSVAKIGDNIDFDTLQASGIKTIRYKLEGATKQGWTEYTQPFQITNTGVTFITAQGEDNSGNIGEHMSIARIGDNIDFDGLGISGIKSLEYRLQGATNSDWTEYISPFEVSTKGITFVLARAIDNAGNIGETTSLIRIGTEELSSVSGIKSVEYKLEGCLQSDWQDYTDPFTLTGEGFLIIMARAMDKAGNIADDVSYVQATILGNSGIDRIEYKLDGATVQDWTEYNNVFTITNRGITSIMARAFDKAGNVAYEHSVAKIGFDSSVISGIDRIEYKLEGATEQDWTEYEDGFYVENEGTTIITARAYDKAGNISDEVTGEVKIDKTAPINNAIWIELLN